LRISIFSNAPWAPTGYGQQSAQLTRRLVADGHEIGFIANWGLTGAPQTHYDGKMVVFPQGNHPYSLDTASFYADTWVGEGGLVLSLYDTWPLRDTPDLFAKQDAWYWCPVDHTPPPPGVVEWTKAHNTIAMAQWGQDQLKRVGVESIYIPHAIETSVFKPSPSNLRERMGLRKGAHLTTSVMANIGQVPPRKRWFENLMAWRIFAARHDDAHLYLHTHLRHPRGIDLPSFIQMWGLPPDRVHFVDQGPMMGGFVTNEDLAAIYTASDVLLMATAGEGFGVPAIEAQACGTPVIVTDFSAQSELVGAGWKVSYVTDWDYAQGSAHALPDVNAIVDALEQSYAASRDPQRVEQMAEQAIAKAAEYDADKVYAERWRPFIEARQHKPERKGMSNAAKRRARKKAA
jgi:glycosyltransferase involved in cell wall biosynthesis